MKELLRFEHLQLQSEDTLYLTDYNLTIFEGEIITLYGVAGSGKECIAGFMEGKYKRIGGRVFFESKLLSAARDFERMRSQVFFLNSSSHIVESMTVIENLAAVHSVRHPFSIFDPDKARKEVCEQLERFNFQIDIDMPVMELTFWERQKVNIVKACQLNAKLIVIDCSANYYNNANLSEMIGMIRSLSKQGMTFIILSEKMNALAEIADRFQYIQRGIDMREWSAKDMLSETQKKLLSHATACWRANYDENESTSPFICLYSDHWVDQMLPQCHELIEKMHECHPDIATQYFDLPLNQKGRRDHGRTVDIPRDSQLYIASNLNIEENLTLCIPERICSFGMIRQKRMHLIHRDFCDLIGLPPSVTAVQDLSPVQKKILSIHRWVLRHPQAMLLEDPFSPFDAQGVQQLKDYLLSIAHIVPKIIILERMLDGVYPFYGTIIKLDDDVNVEIIDSNRVCE